MDIEVAGWVLEFLLRHSVDDRILNAVVSVLSLPIDNSNLKRAMILRRIESEIANGAVSEKILELLERIEELDYEEGANASEMMKGAYWKVAVDCTVKFLDGRDGDADFFNAVKRIWSTRVSKMVTLENVGLVSDELLEWMDEFEAAVWDPRICRNVQVKCRSCNALEAVKAYVSETREAMGPSFLELMAGTLTDDIMREVLGSGDSRVCDQPGETATSLPKPHNDLVACNGNDVLQKSPLLPRRKHVAKKRYRGSVVGSSRGVRITDSDQVDAQTSSNGYGCLLTPLTAKVQDALRASALELQAAVKDPLPEAIKLAEDVKFSLNGGIRNQDPPLGHCHQGSDPPSSSIGGGPNALADEADLNKPCSCHQINVPKPSLMTRNSTARTYEWDDSIDNSPGEDMNVRSVIHLPSPKMKLVSPLKKHENKKSVPRRRIKRWSILEEDTLRTGVEKYGKGNWKVILNSYRDTFEDRTEVDLKDKWRNMTRY